MSDWVGFTDDDLQRMKSKPAGQQSGARVVKPLSGGRPKGAAVIQKSQRKQNPKAVSKSTKSQGDIPDAAMLSKPQSVTKAEEKVNSPPGTPSDQIPLHGKTFPPVSEETDDNLGNEKEIADRDPVLVEDVNIIKQKEKIKLEDVQRRQKEMEEKNKRKKAILAKAIAERKKRAFAESTKLVHIQAELAKLDTMLNYDVSLLRDRIDEACIEYNSSQKRFEKAETEYISAKMCLHKATEMKEELTEHLYQLIQLNEERKAKKLEELMHKLDLEENESMENAPSNQESLKPSLDENSDKTTNAVEETQSETPEVKNEGVKTDNSNEQKVVS